MIVTSLASENGANCGCLSTSCDRRPRSSWARVVRSRSRGELRERRQLAELRQLQLHLARDLPHRPVCADDAHARDRDADVQRRPNARVEQVRLQVDLAIGDRDDVRRDVGRDVVGLRLDDRQRRQRAAAVLLVQLGRALQQPRVQVEHVARDTPRDRQADAAAARSGDTPRRACSGRRRRSARPCPAHMKYSPIAQPANGARYHSGAGS